MVQSVQSGDRLPPVKFLYTQRRHVAAGPSPMTLTITGTEVPGMKFTLSVTRPGAFFIATLVANFDMTAAGVTSCQAQLKVDAEWQPEMARWNPGNTTSGESTVTATSEGSIGVGAHEFAVWAVKSLAAGTHRVMPVHSTLLVQIFE